MPGAASQHGNCLQRLISTDPDVSLRPAGKCTLSQVGMLSSMAHVQPIAILCTLARISLPRLQSNLKCFLGLQSGLYAQQSWTKGA